MHNDTITVFNRLETDEGDSWFATVIHGVNLNIDKASIMAKYGAEAQDGVVLNVPYKLQGGKKIVSGKHWLPPKQWKASNHTDTITFSDGNLFDFFMVGEWNGKSVVHDSEYLADNGFYQYMNRTLDYVFAISAVGLYSVIPHFEILGK